MVGDRPTVVDFAAFDLVRGLWVRRLHRGSRVWQEITEALVRGWQGAPRRGLRVCYAKEAVYGAGQGSTEALVA